MNLGVYLHPVSQQSRRRPSTARRAQLHRKTVIQLPSLAGAGITMFVGHLAVALSAKKLDRRLPLSAATAASFGIDLLWPLLVLAGIEAVEVDPGNTAFTGLSFEINGVYAAVAFALLAATDDRSRDELG